MLAALSGEEGSINLTVAFCKWKQNSLGVDLAQRRKPRAKTWMDE